MSLRVLITSIRVSPDFGLTLRRYAGAPAGTVSPAVPPPALGLNSTANRMNTSAAPADGTSQIPCQSCVTLRHWCAAAAASVQAGFGVAKRLTTHPEANAPMK